MSNEKLKHYATIAALAVFALILFMLFRNNGGYVATGQTEPYSPPPIVPDYLTYNLPKEPPGLAMLAPQPTTVASQSTGGPMPTCGCSSGDQQIYSGLNSFAASLGDKLSSIINNYAANVESSVPQFFSQYVNNPAANDVRATYAQLNGGSLY